MLTLTGVSQTILLSNDLNSLVFGKTTINEAKKILGKPTEKKACTGLPDRIAYNYLDKHFTLQFYSWPKNKTLYAIIIDSTSTISINNVIICGAADTGLVKTMLGNPDPLDANPPSSAFLYTIKGTEYWFVFNNKGILRHVSIFKDSP